MIQFIYNGVTYNVANRATIADRLKQRELLELPLEGWKELLALVNGKADMESLRQVLIGKVNNLEDSKEFEYKGRKLWWDKNTRAGLVNLTNNSYEDIPIIFGNEILKIDPTTLKNLLAQLEVYSSKCFVKTHEHLKAINELKTFEDIMNYDYTLGYPNKVVID